VEYLVELQHFPQYIAAVCHQRALELEDAGLKEEPESFYYD
jgi:hypothetical protein